MICSCQHISLTCLLLLSLSRVIDLNNDLHLIVSLSIVNFRKSEDS